MSSLEKLIKDRYGLMLKETSREEFKTAVHQRARELKLPSVSDYFALFSDRGQEHEMDYLVSRITVGETSFFRTPTQFWALRDFALPALLKDKLHKRQKKIRILSAGCATGEEPYSIAMIAREKIEPGLDLELEILACDVNNEFLELAREGIYSAKDLRQVDDHLKAKYFDKKGPDFQVKPELKKIVRFLHFNLAGPGYRALVPDGNLDVIFCRNVLIYFDPRAFHEALGQFYEIMATNAYLFLGYSESLYGLNSRFDCIYVPEAFFYQKLPVRKERAHQPAKPEKPRLAALEPPRAGAHKQKPEAPRVESIPAAKPRLELISTDHLWEKGWQLFEREEYERARACFETLVEAAPGSSLGHLGLAFVLAHQGEDQPAAKRLKNAFDCDGLLPEGYYLLGLLAERKEEWEKAIENYSRAIFLKSDFAMAHFNLAGLYLRLSELKHAERELKVVAGLLKSGPEKIHLSGVWTNQTLRDWAEGHLKKIQALGK